MANILPVHQMIDRPDFLGTAQHGLAFGNEQRALREQRADEAQLRQLAPQIMAGDVGALEQAAVIDPARAGKFKAAGDVKWQTLKGGYDLVKRAQASGNPQAVQQAWSAYRPWIQKVTGTAPPEDFATAAPHFDQLGMRLAMIEGGQEGDAPTGFREIDMKLRAAGYVPGTPEYQNAMKVAVGTQGRAASGGFGFEEFTGADGIKRIRRTNPRTGQVEIYDEASGEFTPLGTSASLNGGGSAEPYTPPDSSVPVTATTVNIDGMPPEQAQQFAQGMQALQNANASPEVMAAFEQSMLNMPRTVTAPTPPNRAAVLGVGRSAEAEAAAKRQAEQVVDIQNAPTLNAIEADKQRQIAEAKAAAEATADRSKAGTTKAPQLQNVERGLDRIDAALKALEGGRFFDTGPADQLVMQYTPEGQELTNAVGSISNDMLALTRVPGVGSQSDLEQKIANLKYPALGNDPAVNRRNLQQLRDFIADMAASLGRAAPESGAAPAPARIRYDAQGNRL